MRKIAVWVLSLSVLATPAAYAGGTGSGDPVSYTHLDVYKRQDRARVRAASFSWFVGILLGPDCASRLLQFDYNDKK